MKLRIETTTEGVDFLAVKSLLLKENMGTYTVEKHKTAFENSRKVIFLYDGDLLMGCGRLVTDGAYQGVLYDIVVSSDYQGNGLGKIIVTELLKGEEDKNILLYATPGKEGFYQTLGFHKSKTAMCRFINVQSAVEKGLI